MKNTTTRKLLAGIGFAALCGTACGPVLEPEEAEESAAESAEASVAGEPTQEEDTAEATSELTSGNCRARCCDESTHGPTRTASQHVCKLWASSVCQTRDGAELTRWNGVIFWVRPGGC